MPNMLRDMKVTYPSGPGPAAKAFLPALLYVVFCSLYILLSDRWAAAAAETAEQLHRIEIAKGIAFVIVTGVLFFAIMRRRERTILIREKALILSERRSLAGIMAATVAHDLNNLLMSLAGLIEELKEKERDDAFFVAIREGVETGLKNLSLLAKRIACTTKQAISETVTPTAIDEVIRRTITLARKHPDLRTKTVTTSDIPPTIIPLNASFLEAAILNLLVNAGQAAGERGIVSIRLHQDRDYVSLEVHDSGPGITPDQAEVIFTPCYTTKPDGTGLGLLTVKAFANSCGGSITIERSDLGGALFAVRIPKTNEASNKTIDSNEE